jgi:hypothetical protein
MHVKQEYWDKETFKLNYIVRMIETKLWNIIGKLTSSNPNHHVIDTIDKVWNLRLVNFIQYVSKIITRTCDQRMSEFYNNNGISIIKSWVIERLGGPYLYLPIGKE